MSLILDALRKSEAERRRGQSPSQYAQLPTPATRLRPAWMPWLPVALAVLGLVGVGVWYARDADEPVTKEELVKDADAPSLVPPSPEAVVKKDPNAAAPPPVVASAPMAAAPNNTAAAVPAPSSPAAAMASKPPNVDALVQPAPAGARAAPEVAKSSIAAPPIPSPAPAAAASEAEDEVPPMAVLDPTTRESLPPMKLSMHVYNPDPKLRFAIIDGQRVGEGAQLGSAIVLEIRRDGVLLDVGGRRVLLPRP